MWTQYFLLILLQLTGVNKSEGNVHIGNKMKDEVLRRQGISQEDVSEVCQELGSDRCHLAQG